MSSSPKSLLSKKSELIESDEVSKKDVMSSTSQLETLGDLHSFSVVDVSESGVKEYSKEDYDSLVNEAYGSLRHVDKKLQFLEGRSIQTIARLHACLLLNRPFAFLPSDVDPNEFQPKWLVNLIKNKIDRTRSLTAKEQICYAIRTSGSTGKPKLVAVPHRAIFPNINDFRERFGVTVNDRILFSTSLFFDPSIVEIFLCMVTGATIILIADDVRSSPHLLAKVIEEQKPTFVQFTPALFKMFNFTPQNTNMMSSVKTILLGGEKFPLGFVQEYCETHFPQARIYDVYGVTEVSCWATVFEVTKRCLQVPIGESIENTTIRVDDEGAVFIEGPRLCLVNGVQSKSHPTGDWAIKTQTGYILQGRLDNVQIRDGDPPPIADTKFWVDYTMLTTRGGGALYEFIVDKKINGIKLNLENCNEEIQSQVPEVDFARFLVWKEEYLILFVKFHEPHLKSETELQALLRSHSPRNLPVTIITINEIPITNNGKVDNEELLSKMEAIYTIQWRRSRFWEILSRHGIREGMNDALLINYGVKSLSAAELAILLGENATIREILDETTTAGQLVRKYLVEENIYGGGILPGKKVDVVIREGIELKCLWQHNLKKCIDGNPLLVRFENRDLVIAASHSGMIICKDHTNRSTVWEHTLEGRRLEASPTICAGKIFIGSYDGHLLVFDLISGDQLEGIIFPESSIRGQVAVHEDIVFVVTYKNNSHKESDSGAITMFRWHDKQLKTLSLAAGSTACPQVLFHCGMLIVTTVRGTVEAFQFVCENEFIFDHLWRTSVAKAIFSPVVVDDDSILVTSADGFISKLNISSGKVTMSIELGEAFFSSVLPLEEVFLVASQKGSIFVLNKKNLDTIRVLSFKGCSFVRTPSLPVEGLIVVISKDGRLLTANTNQILTSSTPTCCSYRIGAAEVFLEPRFTVDALIVGSRDDHLRAFRFSDIL